tara:strand:+ start:539 stop:934 length:396 start_codon:yes stop_codon:yes gene_type:complete
MIEKQTLLIEATDSQASTLGGILQAEELRLLDVKQRQMEKGRHLRSVVRQAGLKRTNEELANVRHLISEFYSHGPLDDDVETMVTLNAANVQHLVTSSKARGKLTFEQARKEQEAELEALMELARMETAKG